MARRHLGPWDHHMSQIGKGLPGNATYIPNFKHLSRVVLKKKIFEYFSTYFYDLNLEPLARNHLGIWDLHLHKIGKGPLGNAT